MDSDRSDSADAVQRHAVPGELLGEGGGPHRGGAVRAVPVGPPPDICFHYALVCDLLCGASLAFLDAVRGWGLCVVLRPEGEIGGGSDGRELRGRLRRVRG